MKRVLIWRTFASTAKLLNQVEHSIACSAIVALRNLTIIVPLLTIASVIEIIDFS
jgi:hypothetical protein